MINLLPKKILQKAVAVLISIAILFSIGGGVLLYPKPAQALFGIGDIVFDPTMLAKTIENFIREEIRTKLSQLTKQALQIALNQILSMMTNDIVEWIQGDGEPRFITNWQDFLKDAADNAGGTFVDQYLGVGNFCSSFDMDIKMALQSVPTFQEEVKCPISEIGANADDFYNDFDQGGWNAWLAVSQPTGNFYGSLMIARDEMIAREIEAKEAAEAEAIANRGFTSDKVCTEGYIISVMGQITGSCNNGTSCDAIKNQPGFTCTKETTITPGSAISDVAGRTIDREAELLTQQIANLTGEMGVFGPYIIAIGNALYNRVINEGLSLVSSIGPTGDSPDTPLPPGSSTPPAQDAPDYGQLTDDEINRLIDRYIDPDTTPPDFNPPDSIDFEF